jgi:hypothetical protein
MMIATYESRTEGLAANRRWMAQIEKVKGGFFVCFHGATEHEARQKAEDFVAKIPVKTKEASVVQIPVEEAKPRRRDAEDLA